MGSVPDVSQPSRATKSALESGAHFLPALDGWRAVAVFTVFVGHWFALETRAPPIVSRLAESLASQGVNLFFAISGYLITTRLLAELDQRGAISLGRFYTRRAFRILPAAAAYLVVLGALTAMGIVAVPRKEFLSAGLLFSNYWPATQSWFTSHFWSLSLEAHFYLMWPFLLARCGVRLGGYIGLGLAAFSAALWRPWAVIHTQIGPNALHRTDLRLDALLLPAIFAILMMRLPAARQFFTRAGSALAIVAVAAILTAVSVLTYRNPSLENWKTTLVSLMLPLIVIGTTLQRDGVLSRTLDWKPLAWFGRISYSFYVWHKLLQGPFRGAGYGVARFLADLALVTACSAASYYLIETPLIGWGRRLTRRR